MKDLIAVILHYREKKFKVFYHQNKLEWKKKLYGVQCDLYEIHFFGGTQKEHRLIVCKNWMNRIYGAVETKRPLYFYAGLRGRIEI